MKILCVLFPIVFAIPIFEASADMPQHLREYLINQIRLDKKDLRRIEVGQSVVKALPTEKREEIAVFGIIHIGTTPEHFLSKYRNIIEFEAGSSVLQSGMFSSPPQLSDVSSLSWEVDDVRKISKCKSDDCGVRLPEGSVVDFRSKINWSAKGAHIRANEMLRQTVIDFMNKYQSQGDNALPVYRKRGRSISVKDGMHLLLKRLQFVQHYVPKIVSYLRNFPNEKNTDAEDLFYWQKAGFGLQPVIRLSHVIILKSENTEAPTYAIASKMLYANHYFRDGLEVRLLLPDLGKCAGCGFYFVVLNCSHADGMTGLRGWLIRGTTVKKSVEKTHEWLMKTKARIENSFHSSSN